MLQRNAILTVYYNNNNIVSKKKTSYPVTPHIAHSRPHFTTVEDPITLLQQPAATYPFALLSYIRGYFTAMTKGCIFGFDLVGVSREGKKSVFRQIDFYAPPTDFDSAIRQCSPTPLYIYTRSFHSPTAPNPGPSRQRFTLFRYNIIYLYIYILYCYTGI